MSLETLLTLHERIDLDSALARSGADFNDLGTRLNDCIKHYRFTLLRFQDVIAGTPALFATTQAEQVALQALGDGTHPMTSELAALQQARHAAQLRVEMDVESMVIFATITLDRAAPFTQAFLGAGSHVWKSFSNFSHTCTYASQIGATQPSQDLPQSIDWITANITQIRHTYLVHGHDGPDNSRYGFGVWIQNDSGRVSFGHTSTFKPQPHDPQNIIQIWPEDVIERMSEFFDLWAAWLEQNKGLSSGSAPDVPNP